MNDKFNQLEQLIGQPVEREDASAPFQCMDFAFAWCDILGVDRAAIRHQFAYQVWVEANDLTVANFFFIPNTPNGIPLKGDIPVFKPNISGITGEAGHICVATGEGDTTSFNSLDQNWNFPNQNVGKDKDGKLVPVVGKVTHEYSAVYGWLRWKGQGTFVDAITFGKLVAESSSYEEFVKIGYTSADEIINKVASLQNQITFDNNQIGDLTKTNESLVMEVQQTKDALAKQADLTQQQATSDSTSIDTGLNAMEENKLLRSDLLVVAMQVGSTYPPVKNIINPIVELQKQKKLWQISQDSQAKNAQSFWKFFITKFFGKGG